MYFNVISQKKRAIRLGVVAQVTGRGWRRMLRGSFGSVRLDGERAVKQYLNSAGGRLSEDAVREICALAHLPAHPSVVELLRYELTSSSVETHHPRAIDDLFRWIRERPKMSGRSRRHAAPPTRRRNLASPCKRHHASGH